MRPRTGATRLRETSPVGAASSPRGYARNPRFNELLLLDSSAKSVIQPSLGASIVCSASQPSIGSPVPPVVLLVMPPVVLLVVPCVALLSEFPVEATSFAEPLGEPQAIGREQ